jgi:hypothetical protein
MFDPSIYRHWSKYTQENIEAKNNSDFDQDLLNSFW